MKLLALFLITIVSVGATIPSQANAQERYSARAHCKITGATGSGRGSSSREALSNAVASCIAKGGVPSCCRKGAHLDR